MFAAIMQGLSKWIKILILMLKKQLNIFYNFRHFELHTFTHTQ